MNNPRPPAPLASNVYLESMNIATGRVIAVRGTDNVTLVTSGGLATVRINGTGYLQGLDIQNFEILANGLESSGDVWLDDSLIRNNERGLESTAGRVVLRRSRVLDNDTAGLTISGDESVRLINTIVAANGPLDTTGRGGIVTTGAAPLDILYSTIVQNIRSISCELGPVTIRNSIVTDTDFAAPLDCNTIAAATFCVLSDIELSQSLTNIGIENISLLQMNMNYEVAPNSVAAEVAQWIEGDPLTDIDGNLRPVVHRSADYAGAYHPQP